MAVCKQLDRFSLFGYVIDRAPKWASGRLYAQQAIQEKLIDHKQHIAEHDDDMPEISAWAGGLKRPVRTRATICTEGDNVQGNQARCQALPHATSQR